MAPSATFCHSLVALAVGLAANARNAAGLTPRTAMSLPLTFSLAASSDSAALTPASRLIAASEAAGSVLGDTTNRSAGRRARSRPIRGPALRLARPYRCATDLSVALAETAAWPPARG